jgi:hypothetical protein
MCDRGLTWAEGGAGGQPRGLTQASYLFLDAGSLFLNCSAGLNCFQNTIFGTNSKYKIKIKNL